MSSEALDRFELFPPRMRTMLLWLLLLASLFFLPTVMAVSRILAGSAASSDFLRNPFILPLALFLGPAAFAVLLSGLKSHRLLMQGDRLTGGWLHAEKFDLPELVEISGIEGNFDNDFQDALLLIFSDGKAVRLLVDDYEERDLLDFLSRIRKQFPHDCLTYSDVIPLESRGLLRFLASSIQSENLIVSLSRAPIENMVVQLIKEHQVLFFRLYAFFSLVALLLLSWFSISVERAGGGKWTPSETILSLNEQLNSADVGGFWGAVEQLWLRMNLVFQVAVDYFTKSGAEPLAVLWIIIGLAALVVVVARLWSPRFLFVDGESIGVGTRFIHWNRVSRVELTRAGLQSDSLDGCLTITDARRLTNNKIALVLSEVPDVKQRQTLLRLVETYAGEAERNDEFIRTTTSLVDLQFTDLWLDDADGNWDHHLISENEQDASGGTGVGNEPAYLQAGRYRIVRPLGHGGQGTTYLAEAMRPHELHRAAARHRSGNAAANDGDAAPAHPSRWVVIKELVLPRYADIRILQEATARFERAAVLLSELEHPQVVRLWDYFIEQGRACLVMEHIEGRNLRQVVQEHGPLSPIQVQKIGLQLCDILEYLHSRQPPVIHCDFAPDNLILAPGGSVKLLDFDLARVLEPGSFTFVAGRPAYTPPEQFRGSPTTASDIFALGAMLSFLLNGVDPPPAVPGTGYASHGIQSGFEVLIADCLKFNQEDRPTDAAAVRERLRVLEALGPSAGETGESAALVLDLLQDIQEETAPCQPETG